MKQYHTRKETKKDYDWLARIRRERQRVELGDDPRIDKH